MLHDVDRDVAEHLVGDVALQSAIFLGSMALRLIENCCSSVAFASLLHVAQLLSSMPTFNLKIPLTFFFCCSAEAKNKTTNAVDCFILKACV